MRVKHLVMIVNGKHKAKILKDVLTAPISNELPATVLRLWVHRIQEENQLNDLRIVGNYY